MCEVFSAGMYCCLHQAEEQLMCSGPLHSLYHVLARRHACPFSLASTRTTRLAPPPHHLLLRCPSCRPHPAVVPVWQSSGAGDLAPWADTVRHALRPVGPTPAAAGGAGRVARASGCRVSPPCAAPQLRLAVSGRVYHSHLGAACPPPTACITGAGSPGSAPSSGRHCSSCSPAAAVARQGPTPGAAAAAAHQACCTCCGAGQLGGAAADATEPVR
jgi:hypothetical protein